MSQNKTLREEAKDRFYSLFTQVPQADGSIVFEGLGREISEFFISKMRERIEGAKKNGSWDYESNRERQLANEALDDLLDYLK